MAWTSPRTWTPGELVTALMMNLHIRDNLNIVKRCLSDAGDLAPPVATELTIASGEITPTQNGHTVDTESNAASDDLTNIPTTNTRDGFVLLLRPENTARVVTVKSNSGGGNIRLRNTDLAMNHAQDVLVLQRVGSLWFEVCRSVGGGGKPALAFTAASNQPPSSSFATLDTRNAHAVLDFSPTSQEYAIFAGVLPANYNGGSLRVTIYWSATSAISGDVVWTAQFEALASLDIDADSFASAQSATATTHGTSGVLTATAITFTSSQIDGLLAGGAFRLRISRDAANGADTMSGDAELLRVIVEEI